MRARQNIILYAILSLCGFFGGLIILFLMIWREKRIRSFIIPERIGRYGFLPTTDTMTSTMTTNVTHFFTSFSVMRGLLYSRVSFIVTQSGSICYSVMMLRTILIHI